MELFGALHGIRVIEFTRGIAGPYCTMLLADMGAEVIIIEDPDDGAKKRALGGIGLQGKDSAFFIGMNRNKKSVTLSVKTEKGRALLRDLVEKADVFVQNSRPGVAEKLGVGYEALSALNPGLVYCSISGFGQTGPRRDKGGIDPVVQAYAGAMSATGEPGGDPLLCGVPIADIGGAMMASYGILAALLARGRTGSGQKVDVSLLDTVVSMQTPNAALYFATGKIPKPTGNTWGRFAPYESFKAKDGDIYLAITRDGEFARFCEFAGLGNLATDARFSTNKQRFEHRKELQEIVGQAIKERTVGEWAEALDKAQVLGAPVNNFKQLFEDPQVIHNEMLVNMNHPEVGPIKLVGIPVKLDKTPGTIATPSPSLGQHTEELLAGMLGLSRAEIATLRSEGVV